MGCGGIGESTTGLIVRTFDPEKGKVDENRIFTSLLHTPEKT